MRRKLILDLIQYKFLKIRVTEAILLDLKEMEEVLESSLENSVTILNKGGHSLDEIFTVHPTLLSLTSNLIFQS